MSLFPARLWSPWRAAAATAVIAAAGALVAVGPPVQAAPAAVAGWVPLASPAAPPAGYTGSITALAPAGPDSAWAVGADEYAPNGGPLEAISPLAYQWSGGRWVSTPIASPDAYEAIDSVADGGAGDAWTIGAATADPSQEQFQPQIRHWNGSAWTVTPFPNDTQNVDELQFNAVAAAGGKAWISAIDAGNGAIFSWDGKSWTPQQISSASELWGITAISATDAWAVGYGTDDAALAVHWNGTAWQDESPPSQGANLQVVAASGPDDVWAVGSAGTGMAADHWNGSTWAEYQIPVLPGMGDFNVPLGITVDKSGEPWIADYSDRADRTVYFHWNGSAWQVSYGAAQPGVIESYSDALTTLPGDGAILSAGTTTRFGELASPYAELNAAPSAGAQFAAVPVAAASSGEAAVASAPLVPPLRYGAPLSAVRVPGPDGAIPGVQSAGASAQQATASAAGPSAAVPSAAGPSPVTTSAAAASSAAWTPASVPPVSPQSSLNGVAATTGGLAWAVGEQYQGVIAPGDPLVLQRSGGRWTRVALPEVQWRGSLTGVTAVSPTDVWAIGTDIYGGPHVLHDSGGTWTDVPFPGSGNDGVTLLKISAAPGADPWVAGNGPDGPVLLRWTGSQWVSQAAPSGDEGLSTVAVYSATDVWVAGLIPNPDSYYEPLLALSHWNGSAWTTLDTAGTAAWNPSSIVVAGPDDIWIAGADGPGMPIYGVASPLLAHWNGTSWAATSVPVSYGTAPSLTAAPNGQPAWASFAPLYYAYGGIQLPQGEAVYLSYNGTAWTTVYGPVATPAQGNPATYLAAVPGTGQTIAVGTAPYLNDSHEPLIETNGG
jgi:hypothetical protein